MSQKKVRMLIPCEVVEKLSGATKVVANTSMETSADLTIPAAQPDLLFMRSVLVSTGGNKNDDVFVPEEMWNARSTPLLKPVDWEHNTGRELSPEEQLENPGKVIVDNQTIGVMYNAYAIDENGVVIDEAVAKADGFKVPSKFHIIDEAVIWKGLYPSVANKVQQGATNGTLFVSMEAWFTDYHYLVGNKVVARNEETAFLDKSLRANGGSGSYGNNRVRRVLRNITFGGKGIVARPANEPSIITHVSHEPISATASDNQAIANNIVCDIKDTRAVQPRRDVEMPNTEKQVSLELYTKANDELSNLRAECKGKDSELAKASEQITELQSQVDEVKNAFTKGAELLDAVLPGFSSRVTQGNPENFFGVLAEALEGDKAAQAELEKKLEESLAKIAEAELAARTLSRQTKIDSLLGLAETHYMEDEDEEEEEDKEAKAKVSKKKEKMLAAVKDLTDEQFDALYEVWAEQQAEANKAKRDSQAPAPVVAEVTEEKESTSAVELVDTVREVLAGMLAETPSSDSDVSVASDNDEGHSVDMVKALTEKGHSANSVEDVIQAISGYKELTDEDNLMALLDNVKASEQVPSAGEEAPQGIDLRQSFSGLVDKMLGRENEDN